MQTENLPEERLSDFNLKRLLVHPIPIPIGFIYPIPIPISIPVPIGYLILVARSRAGLGLGSGLGLSLNALFGTLAGCRSRPAGCSSASTTTAASGCPKQRNGSDHAQPGEQPQCFTSLHCEYLR